MNRPLTAPLNRTEAIAIVNQMRARGWEAGTEAIDYSDEYAVFYFRPNETNERVVTTRAQWGWNQMCEWS